MIFAEKGDTIGLVTCCNRFPGICNPDFVPNGNCFSFALFGLRRDENLCGSCALELMNLNFTAEGEIDTAKGICVMEPLMKQYNSPGRAEETNGCQRR